MSELKRLKQQLEQLEKTYKLGIIGEDEYNRGKVNIEKKLNPLLQAEEKNKESKKIIEKALEEDEKAKEPVKEKPKKEESKKEEKKATPKPKKEKAEKTKKKDSKKEEKKAKSKPKKQESKKENKEKKEKSEESLYTKISPWIGLAAIIIIVFIFLAIRGPDTTVSFEEKNLTGVNNTAYIIAFSSYSCKNCENMHSTLDSIKELYKDNVKIDIRHYPLNLEQDVLLDLASECAAGTGKEHEMDHELFRVRKPASEEKLISIAKKIGLNESFNECMANKEALPEIVDDYRQAIFLGLEAIPGIYINNELIIGTMPLTIYETVIDKALGISE